MYIESIVSISETEERARRLKAEAALAAKKRVSDSRAAGEAMVAAAIKKAEAEIAEMGRASEERSMAAAKELADSAEAKNTALAGKADKRMAEAVALIVERIVKS